MAQPSSDLFNLFDLEAGKALLREYSGIPETELDAHVELIKEKGLQVAPYPCIRRLRFLDLILTTTEVYPEILQRVKAGEKLLDLACCLGQEIRKLVHDGAPSSNIYGSDLCSGFFDVGYELFKDEAKLQTTFLAADIFDDDSPLVSSLAGKMNIIYVGDVFHLFGLEQQEKVAERIVQLLVAQPGSLIIGRHSGGESPGEYSRSGDTSGHKHYRHSPQSWEELWTRVGERTNSGWSVEADLVAEFKFQPTASSASAAEGQSNSEVEKLLAAKGLRYTIRRV